MSKQTLIKGWFKAGGVKKQKGGVVADRRRNVSLLIISFLFARGLFVAKLRFSMRT